MPGSAITIVLLSDHPANVGIAHDCAVQAAEWLQRSSGCATAVAGVDAFEVEPSIFPTAEVAAAIKSNVADAVIESAPTPDEIQAVADAAAAADHAAWLAEQAATPEVTEPEAPAVEDPAVTEAPVPQTEEVSTPDPANAATSAADVTTTEPADAGPEVTTDSPEPVEAPSAVEVLEAAAEAFVADEAKTDPAAPQQ